MAIQWYVCTSDERRLGPFTPRQLRELAQQAKLIPNDLVWRNGLDKPVYARQLHGLFEPIMPVPPPLPASATNHSVPTHQPVPPPIQPDGTPIEVNTAEQQCPPVPTPPPQVWSSGTLERTARLNYLPAHNTGHGLDSISVKLQSAASLFVSNAKAAAQLVAKTTERTKLQTVSLPNAYNALGKSIFAASTFREELKDAYATLDGHVAAINQLKAQAGAQPKAENMADKARATAKGASDTAQIKLLEAKARHALTELGRAAVAQFGERSGPPDLFQSIEVIKKRLRALDDAIGRLSTSKPGQIVSPKRLAMAGIIALVLVSLTFGYGLVFSGNEKPSTAMQRTAGAEHAQTVTTLRKSSQEANSDIQPSRPTSMHDDHSAAASPTVDRQVASQDHDGTPTSRSQASSVPSHYPKHSQVPHESWSFDKAFEFAQPYRGGNVLLLPDNTFAYCASDFHLRVCDVITGKEMTVVDNLSPPPGEVRYSDSTHTLMWVTGLSPKDGATLLAWNHQLRKVQARLQVQPPTDTTPFGSEGMYSPDCKLIATAARENGTFDPPPVRVWDATTLQTLYESEGRMPVAFSPDGSLLAFGNAKEPGCILWEYTSSKNVASLVRPESKSNKYSRVHLLAFIPNTPLLAVVSNRSKHLIELWNSQSHVLESVLESRVAGNTKDIYAIAVAPDGTFLVTGSKGVHVWHLPSGGQMAALRTTDDVVESVSISDDGNTIAAASGKQVLLWRRQSNQNGQFVFSGRAQQYSGDPVVAKARGPNGEKIMLGGDGLDTEWFFHYYFDENGKTVMHGASRVRVNGTERRESEYERGVMVSRSVYDSQKNLKATYKRLNDGTYQIDELLDDGSQAQTISKFTKADGKESATPIRPPKRLPELSGEFKLQAERKRSHLSKAVESLGPTLFTIRAVAFAHPKFDGELTAVAAGSRADFLQACSLLGNGLGHRFAASSAEPYERVQAVIRMNIDAWTQVFGKPAIESNGYDTFTKMEFQRWSYRCADGPLTLHGNIIDGAHYEDRKTILSSTTVCFY